MAICLSCQNSNWTPPSLTIVFVRDLVCYWPICCNFEIARLPAPHSNLCLNICWQCFRGCSPNHGCWMGFAPMRACRVHPSTTSWLTAIGHERFYRRAQDFSAINSPRMDPDEQASRGSGTPNVGAADMHKNDDVPQESLQRNEHI